MKSILFLCIFASISVMSAEVQNNREHYKSLPITFSGEIVNAEINELAIALFKKFTGLEEELGVFCSNDERLTDARYKWYCQITPLVAVLRENGMGVPYAPDENSWTMRIDLQANTYELKKDWQQINPGED